MNPRKIASSAVIQRWSIDMRAYNISSNTITWSVNRFNKYKIIVDFDICLIIHNYLFFKFFTIGYIWNLIDIRRVFITVL